MDIDVFLKQKPQWAYQPCLYIVKQMFEGNNAYRCGLSGGLQFKDSDRALTLALTVALSLQIRMERRA